MGANSRLGLYLNKYGILNFTNLIQFHLVCRIFAKFSFGPYLSLSKLRKRKRRFLYTYVFTYSIKRALEIRKFHVLVVQRRQRKSPHLASLRTFIQWSTHFLKNCCAGPDWGILFTCHLYKAIDEKIMVTAFLMMDSKVARLVLFFCCCCCCVFFFGANTSQV